MTQWQAFGWTLAIELPVLLCAAFIWRSPLVRALLAGLIANGASHPLAWTIATHVPHESYYWAWYAIEALVVCVEAPVLGFTMQLTTMRAVLLSLLANGASALIGRAVQ